ncbi:MULTISPECIES: glutamine--tRNA ligase/YqeY domain fusion protein [Flavobacteriales]|uniref:Glutamine--tRNA ligase n=2 Tax=Flavobacteriales TaxID=200644 RepID=A0A1M6N7F9_9FLAO|nr:MULTISPECIES: glutamine--tRNA ligase/YqeY domain fusion protein [Flavobacteriales]SHG70874.1 glutaminyl-tRNA synthetase [Flavobacterium johnsoniae]SHJ91668.1 glutaminyl-tRNA synthetase [Epilithonimonas mollis]
MEESLNFIEAIIEQDICNEVYSEGISTRFPPEPNGYLHLGHAKSICLNFGLASKYKGRVNLRFDDTNPERENSSYIDAIRKDIQWLGFEWHNEFYASDYFEILYGFAIELIKRDLAYVDDSTPEEIAEQKGTPQVTGVPNRYRGRSIDENLLLFEAMKVGSFKDGAKVLRAKIDMKAANMHMRDPIIYRIKHTPHHRTGSAWCIYPMYDFAHGQSDAIECITHSTCTLEFVAHRPLYNWFIEKLGLFPSKQIEFARLNLAFTIMSKRKLQQLVEKGLVDGWDDPRLPTVAGLRRRGYTPNAIREFCDRIGVAKRDAITDYNLLEFCVREDLNKTAQRRIAVLKPLRVIITNYGQEFTENIVLENLPGEEAEGSREVPFTRELWIEQDDFMEHPTKNYFRLTLGGAVRLKGAYIILCEHVVKDEDGNISELHCKYFPESKSGHDHSNIKVKSTIHWLSIPFAIPAEIRLYNKLFEIEDPGQTGDEFLKHFNKDSIQVLPNAYVENDLINRDDVGVNFQFVRMGYFIKDRNSTADHFIFNRTVGLRENWKKT